MIVAAALCPWPPVLARELTGRDPVLADLRAACAQATAQLLGAAPELIAVIGPASQTREWDPDCRLDLSVFGPGLGKGGDPALPPSLGLGAALLDQAGYQGRRALHAVSHGETPAACAALGARITMAAGRVGLLAMGDGSARRHEGAPGHFDPRAAAFDRETERAIRDRDLDALLAIEPGLATELMANGRPAWQVLAGALGPARPASDILYAGDPFGVAYLVAFLSP